MEPTLCKVCGERHWGPCAGDQSQLRRMAEASAASPTPERKARVGMNVYPVGTYRGAEKTTADRALARSAAPERGAPDQAAPARKRAAKGSGFDKAAYQRELMRKRRAARKGKP